MTGRVQYGPRVHASTALAVCSNYLPVARAAKLVAALTGVSVSAGFTAGIRGKAAARLGPFMDRVRVLLHAAGVLYGDETPARVAGHLHYVHVACTEFLTAMHVTERHGSLASIPLNAVAGLSAEFAPRVGLHPGTARAALRKAVLAAKNGDAR